MSPFGYSIFLSVNRERLQGLWTTTPQSRVKMASLVKDLSTRSALFRTKLIDEFRLLDSAFESTNKEAPVYSTSDLHLGTILLERRFLSADF